MTDFAVKVYKAVLGIPVGEVRTYKWVAAKAGRPKAARAVGNILNRNPYPLIIPCHRVVRDDSEAGGYLYGANAKKALLKLEKEVARCLENRE